MTSQGFAPQMGPGPDTHYETEFKNKPARPVTPLRPGSSSGNRANNPHPPQVGYIIVIKDVSCIYSLNTCSTHRFKRMKIIMYSLPLNTFKVF
jgi:hypothetical protein